MEKEEVQVKKETTENKRAGSVKVAPKKLPNKPLIITAIILSIIVILMVVFALINKLNTKVYSNIYMNGVDLSGKTEEQVSEFVKELNKQFKSQTLSIKHEGNTLIEITPDSIDMLIDEEETVKSIMNYGRDQNIVVNNVTILKALFGKVEILPTYKYSEPKLTNIATDVTSSVEGRVKDDSFSVDEEEYVLVITRGAAGKDIVIEEFKKDILDKLKEKSSSEYNIELETREPTKLDVDVVYAKVCKEAKDAYVDETVNPIVYHKHEMGISFNKEELRTILNKPENQGEGKIIRFKLTATEPKVKIQDITKDIYKDTLSSYTSEYVNSDSNRASNVALAAKMLNGTIVMPGETFSFNDVMGDCGLSSRGFKSAAVFKAGKVVQEIGGGVCQVSSTLYISVLYANLDIVSRSNHALPVGYVPVSLDATIYYPYLDFKFKNTREYPIKIVATTTSSRKLTIEIHGTKEEKEYEVELTSWRTSTIQPQVQKQNDSSLEKGKTKVIQQGATGCTSVAYKTVKYNGKIVSKVLLSEDSYGSTPKIIAVGTKEVVKDEPEVDNENNQGGTTGNEQTGGTSGDNTSGEQAGGVTDENTSGEQTGGTTDENTGSQQPETNNN